MSDIEYVMVMHDSSKATKFFSEDYCKDLQEQLAFAQSQDFCTVAHENVATCGYCQRDALAAAARTVTCRECGNTGRYQHHTGTWMDCDDCADLRAILGEPT